MTPIQKVKLGLAIAGVGMCLQFVALAGLLVSR